MNTQQKNYAIAKAYLQTCEAEEAESEAKYIRDHGITNPDGTATKSGRMSEPGQLTEQRKTRFSTGWMNSHMITADSPRQTTALTNSTILSLSVTQRKHNNVIIIMTRLYAGLFLCYNLCGNNHVLERSLL